MNRFSSPPVDVHQHLWPPPFVAALRARLEAPRLVGWTLLLDGAPPYRIDPRDHDPAARAEREPAGALACVAPSAVLGIDRLPAAEADALIAAWLEGALALGAPFLAWTAAREPDGLAEALACGAVGLEAGADLLAAPGGLDRLAPLLEVLEAAGRPLLVHPGPTVVAGDRPGWWAPVVPYVQQLHAAWWAWADGGRARFPDLRICFAALAGLAPLHGERRRARGGGRDAVDPLTFLETSSYGTQAVDAVTRALGIDVLCHGSDRPYAEPADPALGQAAWTAIAARNPARLLALGDRAVAA